MRHAARCSCGTANAATPAALLWHVACGSPHDLMLCPALCQALEQEEEKEPVIEEDGEEFVEGDEDEEEDEEEEEVRSSGQMCLSLCALVHR